MKPYSEKGKNTDDGLLWGLKGKRFITVSKENVRMFIECILIAENVGLEQDMQSEYINGLLPKNIIF